MMKTLGLATAIALAAGSAQAATFLHSQTVKEGNAKRELTADFSFNDVSEVFGLSFDFVTDYLTAGPNAEDGLDGAWWVVNNGGEPFGGSTQTSAIMYTDLTDVWAYEYLGSRSRSNPHSKGPLLAYYGNAVSGTDNGDGTTTYSMSLDVSELNNLSDPALGLPANWAGTSFDKQIGTWLHGTYGGFASCDQGANTASALNCFDGSDWNGWDVGRADTTLAPVPLPGAASFAAAPIAMFGFGAWRRRNAATKA